MAHPFAAPGQKSYLDCLMVGAFVLKQNKSTCLLFEFVMLKKWAVAKFPCHRTQKKINMF
jgi:hypothetical protein